MDCVRHTDLLGQKANPRTTWAAITAIALIVAGAAPLAASADTTDDELVWTNDKSPAGGPVGGIAGNPDVLVAGTWADFGAFVSHNNGVNWQSIEDFPPIGEVHNAAWSPHNDELGFISGYGGLARTTDGGATWEHLIDASFTGPIAFHPQDDIVAIHYRPDGGWDHHVWVSHDDGDTWNDLGQAPISGTMLGGIAIGPTPDHIFVTALFRSAVTTNGGETWTELSLGGRALAQEDDGTLWLSGFGPLRKSTDHGQNWQEVSVPTGNPSLVTERPGGGVFAATLDGIILSTDGGETWTNLGFGEATWGALDFMADPQNPDAVFITDENIGIVWIGPTDYGYALQGRTSGFPPVPVNTLGGSADGSILLAGGQFGTYGSPDGGETWNHLGAGMGMGSTRAVDASNDGSTLYTGGQTMFFWPWLASSNDGGLTWNFADINIGGDGYVSGLSTHAEDPETAWVSVWGEFAPSHIFETTDAGATWTAILVLDESINDVAYHAESDTLLAATGLGVLANLASLGWTPVSPSQLVANSIDVHGSEIFSVGNDANVHSNPVDLLPIVAQWAPTDGTGRNVASDLEGGAWATLGNGNLMHCAPAGDLLPLAGTCTAQTPPGGGVQAILVRTDGDRVFAATQSNGLWTAQL